MAVKKKNSKYVISPSFLEEMLDGKIEDKAYPPRQIATAEQSYQNAGPNGVWGKPFGSVGIGSAASFTDNVYKAVIPAFLYKPAFGFPLNKDIPNIRRLSKTPYVAMITNTICNEIASLDWDVVPRDGEKDIPDEIIEQTKNWFYNPNRNDESLDHILRALTRDLIEVDAGLIVKVHNLKGEFLEMYARDGGTFTKNPDIYGIMPDEKAYYQYGWLTGARPIPFNREEIVYFMQNPRTESIYGLSNVEVLNDVLQLLLYGIDSNLEYFSDNNIPKGIFQMIGANADEVKAFQDSWSEQLKKKDSAGNWRKYFHKMPIVNSEGNFVRVGFSNVELELIQQQEWFTKLVWSCFNISPSELGFTENSNKATEFGQNKVVIRKLLKPLVQLIEYNFNTEVVNSLPWIKGKYEDRVFFSFDKYDLQEDLAKRNLFWGDIKNGLRSVNEIREEIDLEPKEGGDDLKQGGSAFGAAEGVQGLLDEYGDNSKKKDEVKALNTFSSLTPREFEEMSDPSFLKDKIVSELDEIEVVIKGFLKKEAGKQTLGQVKAIDTNFIKRITELLSLSKLKAAVDGMVKANFFKGLESVEEQLDRNFLPNQNAINFIQDYTFDNVKGMNEELRNDLRQELQRGLMNGEGVPALSKRVSSVMKVGKVRADAIARTESNRAETAGSIDAMRQSGLKVNKTVLATIDDRTSAICKYLNGKTIGLNEKFVYKGEKFDHNPFHVNCRSTLTYEVIE